jgi:hypothetical protein
MEIENVQASISSTAAANKDPDMVDARQGHRRGSVRRRGGGQEGVAIDLIGGTKQEAGDNNNVV